MVTAAHREIMDQPVPLPIVMEEAALLAMNSFPSRHQRTVFTTAMTLPLLLELNRMDHQRRLASWRVLKMLAAINWPHQAQGLVPKMWVTTSHTLAAELPFQTTVFFGRLMLTVQPFLIVLRYMLPLTSRMEMVKHQEIMC